MADSKAQAAKIWAALEQRLIGRLHLRDGRELQAERPHMIRCIGDELALEPVTLDDSGPHTVTARATGDLRTARSNVLQTVGATASARRRSPVRFKHKQVAVETRLTGLPDDKTIDGMLNRYLDQACSLRGLDGDDPVEYR